MPRPLSAWNKFVKTVFHNERKQNPKCTFSDALKKASKLKKAGKMKGGLGGLDGTENNISSTSTGMDMIESSGTGTGMGTSSSMTGGKTRKVKSKKSRKTKKNVKSRKSKK